MSAAPLALLPRSLARKGLAWAAVLLLGVGILANPLRAADPAAEVDIPALWAKLGGRDANQALTAIGQLVAADRATAAFLAGKLRAAETPVDHVRELIGQLDDERFVVRRQASRELERFGSVAVEELRAALKCPEKPLEARNRLRQLLARATSPQIWSSQELQTRRAIAVLEQIGGPEARKVLAYVASGIPSARPSRWAKAALQRLDARERLTAARAMADAKTPVTKLRARSVRTLGTPSTVYKAVFSPDGKFVATAGGARNAGQVVLFNAVSGEQVRIRSDLPAAALSLAFSPDGRWLAASGGYVPASSSKQGWVHVWDVTTGEPLLPLAGDFKPLLSVAFSPDGSWLAASGYAGKIYVWEMATGRLALPPLSHGTGVFQIAFSPDGKSLASGGASSYSTSTKGKACLWELATGRKVRELTGQKGPVFSVAYSPDGRLLATGNGDKTIRLWNPKTGQAVRTLSGHTSSIYSVMFSPNGRRILSGDGYSGVRLWEVSTGKQLCAVSGHKGRIYRATFGPQGKRLIRTGSNAQIWELTVAPAAGQ